MFDSNNANQEHDYRNVVAVRQEWDDSGLGPDRDKWIDLEWGLYNAFFGPIQLPEVD